jgi:hypothetical protein
VKVVDAEGDGDGDHVTSGGEFAGGTNPTDGEDYPRLAVSVTGEVAELSFEAPAAEGPGYDGLTRRYVLESTDDLGSGTWNLLLEGTASGQTVTQEVTGAEGRYRVRFWLHGP